MAFELHVWSPAFNLPSIDPQCLAAIAYLSFISQQIDTQFQWQIIPSNDPAICPSKELPALKDPSTGTIIGGLQNIIDHLRTRDPSWDLDQGFEDDPFKAADNIAFTSHISTRGNILLALSLFVSTENYTTTTRPAYSSILPWPTQYIVPPNLRSKARELTAHLGLTSPDLDANEDAETTNKSIIPDSLRTFRTTTTTNSSSSNHPKSLTETLAHHQPSTHFRLEALIDDFCDPLSSLLAHHPTQQPPHYLLSPHHPSSIDPLATAYLTLMLHPPLPQNWLQTRLRTRWPELANYANQAATQFWGASPEPTSTTETNTSAPNAPLLPWTPPPHPQKDILSRTLSALTAAYIPTTTSTTIIPIPIPTPSAATTATGLPDKNSDLPPPPPSQDHQQQQQQQQHGAHTLPTVLLAATAFATALAAVSTWVLVPYLSSSAGEGDGGRKLSEMGEAGGMLAEVFGVGVGDGETEGGGL